MSIHEMQVKLEALVDGVRITEERQEALNLERRRLVVDHSLLLHRDSASADDIRAMIRHLEDAGMPGTATLKMDGFSERHTRMHASWSTDPDDASTEDDEYPIQVKPTAADLRESERQQEIEHASMYGVGDTVVRTGDARRVKTRGMILGRDAADPTRFHVKWANRSEPSWHYAHDLALVPDPEPDQMPEEMPTDGPEEIER